MWRSREKISQHNIDISHLQCQLQRILHPNTFSKNWKSALRSGILFASTELMHGPRSDYSLHFDIKRTHTKFVRKNKMLALGVCFSQPCSSAGRRLKTYLMGWLRLVGSIKLQVTFAKEPYKRDIILQKKPMILSILLTIATPQHTKDISHMWIRHRRQFTFASLE